MRSPRRRWFKLNAPQGYFHWMLRFLRIICNNYFFCAPARGIPFPTKGKVSERFALRETLSPYGNTLCPPRLGRRSGRGMSLLSRNLKGRGNADKSGSGEVETGRLCSRRRSSFISGNARGLHRGNDCAAPARVGERKFPQAWRAMIVTW